MSEFPTQPKFKVKEKLGQGAFGAAYKVFNEEDNNYYVIKKILLKSAKENEINEIKKEAKILSELKSENIVKYYDSFSDNDSFNIIMEYCDGLDLRKFINEHRSANDLIKKNIIMHIIFGICLGLKEIHQHNLIHRDLKPDNIFLNADLTVKIGDFGISKKLQNANDYAKTQTGTMLYMAPEIINGEKYNNKVDMWALGCIIHELCTLNFCFQSKSIHGLIEKIINVEHGKIDKNYGEDLQKLIDSLLNKDYKKRPSVDEVSITIDKYFTGKIKEKIMEIFQLDESYQNYIIERNVLNSINQVKESIIARENKFLEIKSFGGYMLMSISLRIILGAFTGWFSTFAFLALAYSSGYFIGYKQKVNEKFITNNLVIIQNIQSTLITSIKEKLDKNILKQTVIIYNKENFYNKMMKIKNKLLEKKYLEKLQKIFTKNFNVLILGCTNTGKSTLINEFLKLPDNIKAKESTGGPTDTIDFSPYEGKIKDKNYTLYDTNGITNEGEDSIESKQKNVIEEINKRIKSHDPNQLIHCIWYCFQGSNIQPSDRNFIQNLLNIYTSYSIPIIYKHTQTYSIKQSNTCKLGLEKYLNQIFNNDKDKVEQQLNNYINILARGDEEEGKEAFGLDKLEQLSQKEIETKGLKSSYFEYIKNDIIPILINGVFNLIFTEYNIKTLKIESMKSIEKFLNAILNIVNSDNLGLLQDVKDKNKNSLQSICDCFKNIRDNLKDNLMNLLEFKNLKNNYQDFIKNVYDRKSDAYKKEMSYEKFCQYVENLIYNNISHNKNEIINNLINLGFISFILEVIKSGINEQFKDSEEKILNEIYTEIFKELNKN